MVWFGEQRECTRDLLRGHGWWAAEALAPGASGGEALVGVGSMIVRANSARAAKTWKTNMPPAVVVVSSFSCRDWKPTPARLSRPTMVMRSSRERPSRSRDRRPGTNVRESHASQDQVITIDSGGR